ncbi:MAG: Uma2 family endonuclease [Methylococcales bacterium]|nr:Uma2 family endonuclease [Methylococcales bacterium]
MSVSTESSYKKHLTNLAEWKKLGEANIFPPESRLELINGEIIEMAPIGSNHSGHINRLTQIFVRLVSNQAVVSVQNPVQLDDLSEPEPDLMLLKPSSDFYSSHHPDASHVLLLIEVADSSLQFDQNQKLRLYAIHKIPEYWLLNIKDLCLEVYRQPHDGLYAEKTTLRAGDKITLSQLNNMSINIADIL